MTDPLLSVELKGPFFTKDPGKTFRANAREAMLRIVEAGADDIRSSAPVLTGDWRAGIVARARSLRGRPWALTAVVSQTHVEPWPNAGPKEYRGGKVERKYRLFRKAARVMRSRRREVNNLLKGLE